MLLQGVLIGASVLAGLRGCNQLREVGVSHCLVKPVTPSELLESLTHELGIETRRRGKPEIGIQQIKQTRPLRLLLSEDGRVNQIVATNLLEGRGHTVVVAADGQEAVTPFKSDQFDAIFMDIQMPELNGYEATAAIREHERKDGGHIPIIAMTANAMKGDREMCLGAGMDDYVSKPIDANVVFEKLVFFFGDD